MHPLLGSFLDNEWVNLAIVGVIVGVILSACLRERGFGFFGNAVIGVVGAILGAFVWDKLLSKVVSFRLDTLKIDLNQVVIGLLGAFLFIAVLSFVMKRKKSAGSS
ncbi:MAG: hypothetical protein AAF585_16095 [Verrucomicrobiota bacterium]